MLRKILPGAAILAASVAFATPAGAAAKRYTAADEMYLQTSMQGDLFEIQGGALSQKQGSAAEVKAIGARYEKDHAASLKDARKLAKALGIKRETEPTPSEQWELQEIGGFSGADFDRRYASLEVFDHRQDIMETKDEISMGTNKRVVAMARTELKMLRTHLKLAQAAATAVGA